MTGFQLLVSRTAFPINKWKSFSLIFCPKNFSDIVVLSSLKRKLKVWIFSCSIQHLKLLSGASTDWRETELPFFGFFRSARCDCVALIKIKSVRFNEHMDRERAWTTKDSSFPPFPTPPLPPVALIGIMRWRLVGTKLLWGANGDIIVVCVWICVYVCVSGCLGDHTQAPLGY